MLKNKKSILEYGNGISDCINIGLSVCMNFIRLTAPDVVDTNSE